MNKAFSILRRKLDNLERHKKNYGGSKIRDEILKFDDFANLFEFDLKKVINSSNIHINLS